MRGSLPSASIAPDSTFEIHHAVIKSPISLCESRTPEIELDAQGGRP